MAFASPSPSARPILAIDETSTSGPKTYNFTIPQDAQSIVVKAFLDSTWSATGTAKVTVQTSEDGGTTWRDVAATTVGGNTVAAGVGNQNAHFITIPVAGATGRGIANYIGSVAASTLALGATSGSVVGIASGLPMMGTLGRLQFDYTATISTGGVNVTVYAPTTDYTG